MPELAFHPRHGLVAFFFHSLRRSDESQTRHSMRLPFLSRVFVEMMVLDVFLFFAFLAFPTQSGNQEQLHFAINPKVWMLHPSLVLMTPSCLCLSTNSAVILRGSPLIRFVMYHCYIHTQLSHWNLDGETKVGPSHRCWTGIASSSTLCTPSPGELRHFPTWGNKMNSPIKLQNYYRSSALENLTKCILDI